MLLDAAVFSELHKTRPEHRAIMWLRAYGRTVATRNVRHFAPTGVTVFDPFKAE